MHENNEIIKAIHNECHDEQNYFKSEENDSDFLDTRKCEYCNAECRATDTFCSNCGEKLDFKPSLIYGDYRRDQKKSNEDIEMSNFIGENYDFYLKNLKFRMFQNRIEHGIGQLF